MWITEITTYRGEKVDKVKITERREREEGYREKIYE